LFDTLVIYDFIVIALMFASDSGILYKYIHIIYVCTIVIQTCVPLFIRDGIEHVDMC
jgi:hypothetical protein